MFERKEIYADRTVGKDDFYIVSHKQVTARELADYFEVSTRTIYRDMNTLTLSGIPVISKRERAEAFH